ncbi:MAG: methylated-DNA--[protein]-cysteine S-methyltransferase [Actinomycetota bacterium]
MMGLSGAVCLTPLGPFGFIERHGKVIRSGFTDDMQQLAGEISEPLGDAHPSPTAHLIDRYFEGDMKALGEIEVHQEGTDFRRAVWAELRRIAPGAPVSYGELAERVGAPRAARAVGTSCRTNPVALIVPCHRVIKAGGAPGKYGWEPRRKTWLLEHESKWA